MKFTSGVFFGVSVAVAAFGLWYHNPMCVLALHGFYLSGLFYFDAI